jgi:hypothetical protein
MLRRESAAESTRERGGSEEKTGLSPLNCESRERERERRDSGK